MRGRNRYLLILTAVGLLSLTCCEEPTLQEEFLEAYGKQCFISIQVQRANSYLNWKSPMSVASTRMMLR